jgi:hypothetical protein
MLPKVITVTEKFRNSTNHFDCAHASLPSRDRAGIDQGYSYNGNLYCSESVFWLLMLWRPFARADEINI